VSGRRSHSRKVSRPIFKHLTNILNWAKNVFPTLTSPTSNQDVLSRFLLGALCGATLSPVDVDPRPILRKNEINAHLCLIRSRRTFCAASTVLRRLNRFASSSSLCCKKNNRCTIYPGTASNRQAACRKFKYLGMIFNPCRRPNNSSHPQGAWRKNKGFDTRVDEANAVLCGLYHSLVTKRELANNANLSVFESVFVSILTCMVMNLG